MPDSYDGIYLDLVVAGVKVRATNYFQSLEVVVPSEGSWSGTLTLFDADHDYLDSLIYQAGATTPIDVTFGYANDMTQRVFLAGAVIKTGVDFTIDGTALTIELVSRDLVGSVLDKKNRSFEEGLSVSSIVSTIVEDEGWNTTDFTGGHTIEETEGITTEALVTTDESALKFIRDQLVPQSVNTNGEGDYKLYFDRSGAFHFHTKNFLKPKSKRYIVRRAANGEVISFAPSDTEMFAALVGGGNASYTSLDAKSGASSNTSVTQGGGVDGEGVTTTSGSTYNKPAASGVAYRQAIISRTPDDAKRRAKAFYDRARQMAYTATLDVRGTGDVEVLDYVQVDVVKLDGSLHFLSGKFQVITVTHTIGTEGWKTSFSCTRTGITISEGGEPQEVKSSYDPQTSGQGGQTEQTITVEES
jgi:hypothetical protein